MTEPEQILTHIRNCRRIDLYADEKPITFAETEQWISILKRREQGEPLQYILGFTEFMGLKFHVDPRVLIPRPETELLVEAVIEKELTRFDDEVLEILDIGTGSGCIAISLAHSLSKPSITAVDISQGALDLATSNARINLVEGKIKFIQSDLFESIPQQLFNFIVSNPPYIATIDLSLLDRELSFEPSLALDGGSDGMNVYRRIFKNAGKYLKPHGLLFLEIGADQKDALYEIVKSYPDLKILECRKDLANRNRILILERTHGKMGH